MTKIEEKDEEIKRLTAQRDMLSGQLEELNIRLDVMTQRFAEEMNAHSETRVRMQHVVKLNQALRAQTESGGDQSVPGSEPTGQLH